MFRSALLRTDPVRSTSFVIVNADEDNDFGLRLL